MTHPYRLHATAAAHSLHNALTALAPLARAERAADREPRDGLKSWAPGIGGGGGSGHGDPSGTLAVATQRRSPCARLEADVANTLHWLATQLNLDGTGELLSRITAAIPDLRPVLAGRAYQWLHEADTAVREQLGMMPDEWPLPVAQACPACSAYLLRVQVAAPDSAAWTVVCTRDCVCLGDGCPCGMPVRVVGVRHIWDRSSALVAEQLARMPRRRIRPGRR
ncbi:hypothetical protein [Micromonospora sp. NPDC004704]